MRGVPRDEWCTCTPTVIFDDAEYPPQASAQLPPLLAWVGSALGFGGGGGGGGGGEKKEEGKGKDEL
jgi:hypothetical protein